MIIIYKGNNSSIMIACTIILGTFKVAEKTTADFSTSTDILLYKYWKNSDTNSAVESLTQLKF